MAQRFNRISDGDLENLVKRCKLWRSPRIPILTEAELPPVELHHGRVDPYHGYEYWRNVLLQRSNYLPQDISMEILLDKLNASSPFISNYPQAHAWRRERPRVEELAWLVGWRRSVNGKIVNLRLNMEGGATAPPSLPTRLDL